ncbi:MAG: D-alanyl-D-alanine carboxypeptidase family protein [Clostridia bacterium]|nr:D-alanyl-D-alanine carboxypeptidase family protein [Clostridia bacterium]
MAKIRRKRRNPLLPLVIVLAVAVVALAVLLVVLNGGSGPDPTPDADLSTTTSTTTTTAAPVPQAGMYVTTDVLNVRRGPGTSYEVLKTLPANTEVKVLEYKDGWWRIDLQGEEAYISADYVVPVNAASADKTSTTSTTKKTTTTSTTAKGGTVTSPQYKDRYIDEEGMLQFAAGDNYVQKKSATRTTPWYLLLVNDWNPMDKGYDTKVTMKKVDRYAVNGNQKVDARMYDDLMAMLEAGKAYNIGVQSSYRPYSKQEQLYWNKVDSMRGTYSDPVVMQTKAGEVVKRPGFSEHNTGLAVDLYGSGDYSLTASFAKTNAYKWLMENCADYGFILRFPKGKESVTGVIYEAWHFRYVGDPEIAHKIMDSGLCLEEYLAQTKQ